MWSSINLVGGGGIRRQWADNTGADVGMEDAREDASEDVWEQ